MNPQAFEASLQAAGFSPAVPIERPAGFSLDEHEHPFEAWALVTAGDITLVVGGTPRTYGVGEMFRLPAGMPHQESVGPAGVRYLSGRKEVAA